MSKTFLIVTCGSMQDDAAALPSEVERRAFEERVRPYLPSPIQMMLVSEDIRSMYLARTLRDKSVTSCNTFYPRRQLDDPSEALMAAVDKVFDALPDRSVIFTWPALLDLLGFEDSRPMHVYQYVADDESKVSIMDLIPSWVSPWMPAY